MRKTKVIFYSLSVIILASCHGSDTHFDADEEPLYPKLNPIFSNFQEFDSNYFNLVGSAPCDTEFGISGIEPSEDDKFPVFIYLVGTIENYNNLAASNAIEIMASYGYVAATVDYSNDNLFTFGECSRMLNKSNCIFDIESENSALSKICQREKADCDKGIAIAGFSQGAVLGILANESERNVRGVYGLGAGVEYQDPYSGAGRVDLRECLLPENRTLPSRDLRIVNGESDEFLNTSVTSVRENTEELAGLTCEVTEQSCLRGNESGWYLVSGEETEDGFADHCYMRDGGCFVSDSQLDTRWETESLAWSLHTNLAWLRSLHRSRQ